MLGRKISDRNVLNHTDEYDEQYSSSAHINEIRGLALHGRKNRQMTTDAANKSRIMAPLRSLQQYTRYFRRNLPKNWLPEPTRVSSWPLINFAVRTYTNLFLTFLFDYSMLVVSPVNAIMLLTVYPAMIFLLITVELSLKIFLDFLGGQELVTYFSLRYGGGLSPVNWATPHLFHTQGNVDLMLATIPTLGEAPSDTRSPSATHVRYFDISKAEVMMLLSALIYERDASKVKEAYQMYADDNDSELKEDEKEARENKMHVLLWESEKRVRQIARRWGLHFAGVSELKSLGGPFCGMFWSTQHNCIIVTLKGTTIDNYEEIMLDAAIQRTDARPFLFGSCHQGFYESVFPSSGGFANDTRDPYGTILEALHERARKIQSRRDSSDPVNIWVTGHSLGSAMSCLIFARWLRCPEDMDPKLCVLRDAYTIGTPAVGDNDFAAGFASYTNTPYSRTSTLWRIINKKDIITRLPIGTDNPIIGRHFSRNDFFNYSHVGQAIELLSLWHEEPAKIYPSTYQPSLKVQVVLGGYNTSNSANIIHGQERFTEEEEAYNVSSPTDSSVSSRSGSQILQLTKVKRRSASDYKPVETYKPIPILIRRLDENGMFDKLDTWLDGKNPIQLFESLYPFFFMDHIPHEYYTALQRLRHYHEQQNEKTAVTKPKSA
ncbi:Alpha/Beta hydrolase protein [Umbelopsis sp. AD052]|nr:Alpha/Beta hydrolase protein [Umbelopsis sp. AD052]